MMVGDKALNFKFIRNIYHFRGEGGRNLLLYKIIPVDGVEEVVSFDLLLIIQANKMMNWTSDMGRRGLNNRTHKIIPGAQPVCAVLLQETLQEGPGRVGCSRAHPQRLVENVVVHFVRIPAIERWLKRETKDERRHALLLNYNVKATVRLKLTSPNSISYSTDPRHHQSTVLS